MSDETQDCRYCTAAFSRDVCSSDGDHRPEVVAVATALARVIHEEDPPTDEAIGWFIEDAEDAVAAVGRALPDWSVVDLGYDARNYYRYFSIGGLRFRTPSPEADGWNPLDPDFTRRELDAIPAARTPLDGGRQ